MSQQIIGGPGYREIQPGKRWQPSVGWTVDRRWRGTRTELEILCDALLASGAPLGASLELESGLFWILTLSYAANSAQAQVPDELDPNAQIVTLWSRLSNRLEKDAWEAPLVRSSLLAALPGDANLQTRLLFRSSVEKFIEGDALTASDVGLVEEPEFITLDNILSMLDLAGSGSDAIKAVFRAFIQDLSLGVKAFASTAYVLRRVQVAPVGADLSPNDTNVGRVLATAALITTEAFPANLKFNLAEGYWLKSAPDYEQQDATRVQVTTEFEFFGVEYSGVLYGEAA